ncbi:hypothetical protein D3C74_252780 [compost metagenome]
MPLSLGNSCSASCSAITEGWFASKLAALFRSIEFTLGHTALNPPASKIQTASVIHLDLRPATSWDSRPSILSIYDSISLSLS